MRNFTNFTAYKLMNNYINQKLNSEHSLSSRMVPKLLSLVWVLVVLLDFVQPVVQAAAHYLVVNVGLILQIVYCSCCLLSMVVLDLEYQW